MDCIPPGSSERISQARILEWLAIPFSRGSSWPKDWTCISCTGKRLLYHLGSALQEGQPCQFSSTQLRRVRVPDSCPSSPPLSPPRKGAGLGCHTLQGTTIFNKITSVLTAASLRIEVPVTIHEGAQYPPGRLLSTQGTLGLSARQTPCCGQGWWTRTTSQTESQDLTHSLRQCAPADRNELPAPQHWEMHLTPEEAQTKSVCLAEDPRAEGRDEGRDRRGTKSTCRKGLSQAPQ